VKNGIKKAESNIVISAGLTTKALMASPSTRSAPQQCLPFKSSKVHEVNPLEYFRHERLHVDHKVTGDHESVATTVQIGK